jgi:hypothetical protein
VVYKRLHRYLSARTPVDTLELAPVSRAQQLACVLAGTPPEAARHAGGANRARLAARLKQGSYDCVLYAHEAAFPLSDEPLPAGVRKVLFSHNVHSLIAETDTTLRGRLLRRAAVGFDRRWYSDPGAEIVCISRSDVEGLRRIGVDRPAIAVAPPGAPPAVELSAEAAILPELVLTGSYGWWRKRRDLKRFAAEPALPYPILANDPVALDILGPQAKAADPAEVDWGAGVRFALITDRFVGGFKLKSLEYVALNCMVLSFCDLSAEFADLPFAETFMRKVGSKAEAGAAIRSALALPAPPLLQQFAAFKAACLARYDWEACLAPLGRAVAGGPAERSAVA